MALNHNHFWFQGDHICLDQQLMNHQATIFRIGSILRTNRLQTLQYMKRCLYTVGMGNNDYINNYFMPQLYPTSRHYTPEQYAEVLISQYTRQILVSNSSFHIFETWKQVLQFDENWLLGLYFLKTLYNKYGARKVALIGLGLIGCTPHAISKTNRTACVDELNSAAQLFNQKLVSLVDHLNTNLTDAKFIFVNSTGMSTGDPTSVGKCI